MMKKIKMINEITPLYRWIYAVIPFSLIYGGIFGATNVYDLTGISTGVIICLSVLHWMMIYSLVFMIIYVPVFLRAGSQVFLSLSMSRREIRRLVALLVGIITVMQLIMMTVLYYVDVRVLNQGRAFYLLGVNLSQGIGFGRLLLAGVVVLWVVMVTLGLATMIGMLYGWQCCTAFIISCIAGVVALAVDIIHMVSYGIHYYRLVGGGLVLCLLGFGLIWQGINKIEVKH